MKTFKIEHGIPIKRLRKPKAVKEKKVKKQKFTYPFSEMFVGDSFFVKGNNKYVKRCGWYSNYSFNKLADKIRREADRYAEHNSLSSSAKESFMKFTIRKAEGGFRCWRTK